MRQAVRNTWKDNRTVQPRRWSED